MNYIPDTSYWIEYLKGNDFVVFEIDSLVPEHNLIGISPIFGELLQGAKSEKEVSIINSIWDELFKINENGLFMKAGIYSYHTGLINKGIGIIDSCIIVTSIKENAKVLTLDKKLKKHIEEI